MSLTRDEYVIEISNFKEREEKACNDFLNAETNLKNTLQNVESIAALDDLLDHLTTKQNAYSSVLSHLKHITTEIHVKFNRSKQKAEIELVKNANALLHQMQLVVSHANKRMIKLNK